ncbi:MAG: hypothetical protein JSV42_02780 [Chloroflexota bacterium]|nr:MAG: hypothetical protein JSV42_02780 [Chloroflexota bacterium]
MIIESNLAQESWLRSLGTSRFNRYALRWGRTAGLRLYAIDVRVELANQSNFRDSHPIEN